MRGNLHHPRDLAADPVSHETGRGRLSRRTNIRPGSNEAKLKFSKKPEEKAPTYRVMAGRYLKAAEASSTNQMRKALLLERAGKCLFMAGFSTESMQVQTRAYGTFKGISPELATEYEARVEAFLSKETGKKVYVEFGAPTM